jgi:hypothetical protein
MLATMAACNCTLLVAEVPATKERVSWRGSFLRCVCVQRGSPYSVDLIRATWYQYYNS